MDQQLESPRRLSFRAVTAGVISILALMILFMLPAVGLGLWEFDVNNLPELGSPFWIWTLAAWTVSNFTAAHIAAVDSRTKRPQEGILHGFIVWSGASVIGALVIGIESGSVFSGVLLPISSTMMVWGAFLSDLIGLVAALCGGLSGAFFESRFLSAHDSSTEIRDHGYKPAFSH